LAVDVNPPEPRRSLGGRARAGFASRIGSVRVFGYAIVEQATFSAASFVVVLILARWLSPTDFGVFSSFYAAFLLIQNVFDAIIIEPLAIFGASRYAASFRHYLARIMVAHAAIGGAVVVIVGLGFLMLRESGVPAVRADVLSLVATTPLLLMRWVVRQPCYVLEHAEWSILANGVFVVLAVGSFWLLARGDMLVPSSALLSLGVAAAVSSALVAAIWLKPRWRGSPHPLALRTLAAEHWGYGRWATADKVLAWVSGQLVFVLLPAFSGFASAGALRALTTLLTPAYMTMMAINGLLLPRFARLQASPGRDEAWSRMGRILMVALAGMGIYAAAVVIFGPALMTLLYVGKYDGYVSLPVMLLLALGPVLGAATSVVEVVLRAQQRVKLMFASKVLPAAVAVIAGIPLMFWLGILGALAVTVFGAALTLLALGRTARRLARGASRA
jgi:O-antigen/teichoic acid export membrane protein